MRKSITARYDELSRRAAPEVRILTGAHPADPVHVTLVEVFEELLSMGAGLASATTPLHLRIAMRTLEQIRPALLEGLTDVPPDKIITFFTDIRSKIDAIITAGEDDDDRAHHPGSDIAEA